MAKKSKNGDQEKLDPSTLDRVIELLEQEKPITKKSACDILNIAYNTTRLNSILEKHKEKKSRDRQLRAEKRGKPAQQSEIQFVISSYLEDSSIENISNSIYRGTSFVKAILDTYNVPIRSRAQNYRKPELIPDDAVCTAFELGETVWSARYNCTAKVEAEIKHPDEKVYRVWLVGEEQYAYQPASELASLRHLQELGVAV